MHIALLPPAGNDEVSRRFERLTLRAETLSGGVVKPLGPGSAELVYVVPFSAFRTPAWPRLRTLLAHANRLFVVVGTGLASADFMTAARDGAFDVLVLEDSDERWRTALQRTADSQKVWVQLYGGAPLDSEHALIGQSEAMRRLRQAIERLGPTDVSVLIVGESGVGKEKVAAALHQAGRRKTFLAVNCAAIPKELIEAELFGAEKGAYTGSVKSRRGLVEQADGGTLFLDEVGDLEIGLQPKLLRFLETRTARRVGGEADYRVRVRMIAATNRDLSAGVTEGRFREDLYYRLSEMVLQVPSLRERLDDVPLFVREFLQRANERFGKHIESLEPALIQRFQKHDWPGNVRELKSAVDRLVLLYDGPILREGWWEPPPPLLTHRPGSQSAPTEPSHSANLAPGGMTTLPGRWQRLDLARQLFAEGRLRLSEIAARTGVHPTTLFRWRKAGKL